MTRRRGVRLAKTPYRPYLVPPMRRLFALTLALYAFSVLDLHEWAHVPATVTHWVEHHTDLGHHDEALGHHHDEHGDHSPFGCDEHGTCTAFAFVGMVLEVEVATIMNSVIDRPIAVLFDEGALAAFSGSKWNPPKA
jgi:hypothetical protein